MENAEFDKFIRSNTQKDLKAPESLDWENMDIKLPAEKKKRRFFILWFGFLFIIFSSAVIIYLQKEGKNAPLLNNKNINSSSILQESKIQNKSNTITLANQKDIKKNTNNQDLFKPEEKSHPSIVEPPISLETSDKLSLIDPITNAKVILMDSTQNSESISIKTQKQINPIPDIPSFQYLKLKEQNQKIISLTDRILTQSKIIKPKKSSLLFSIGFNTLNTNYQPSIQTQELQAAEEEAYGTNYNLGYENTLKKDFYTYIGISYQRLHKTFEFEEIKLEESLLERVTSFKYVFHNNYYDIVALNIEMGKTISIGKHWGSKIALNINPSYMVNIEGRTLNNTKSIIDIRENLYQQQLFSSLGTRLKLFYTLKGKIIFASFAYQKSIKEINFIENSLLKYRPEIFSFNLGIGKTF